MKEVNNQEIIKSFSWVAKDGVVEDYGHIGGVSVVRFISKDDNKERFGTVYFKNPPDGWISGDHVYDTYQEAILFGLAKGDAKVSECMYKIIKE